MKKVSFILCCPVFIFQTHASSISDGVAIMSLGNTLSSSDKDSWLNKILAAKGNVDIEQIMISVNQNMNQGGAVKLHVLIVYEKELIAELEKMSSREYFRQVDQLIKDHPDKMKIFSWELVAKQRIGPWTPLEYPIGHMIPLAGFVFADYSTNGEHRAQLPIGKKVKITLEENDFEITTVKD